MKFLLGSRVESAPEGAEVLSPSTEAHDRGVKFAHYRRLPSLHRTESDCGGAQDESEKVHA